MLTLAIKLMWNCLNYLFFLTLLILGFSNQVQIVKAQPIEVYSTNFDSLNPGLALTGQDGWVTNDPKGPGGPAGESDGLTRLVFPDGESSRAEWGRPGGFQEQGSEGGSARAPGGEGGPKAPRDHISRCRPCPGPSRRPSPRSRSRTRR